MASHNPLLSPFYCDTQNWKTKALELSNVKCLPFLHPLFSCNADGYGGRNLWLSSMLLINSWCQTCFLPRDFGVAALSTKSTFCLSARERRTGLRYGLPCWCVFQVGSNSHGREQMVLELFPGSSNSPSVCLCL